MPRRSPRPPPALPGSLLRPPPAFPRRLLVLPSHLLRHPRALPLRAPQRRLQRRPRLQRRLRVLTRRSPRRRRVVPRSARWRSRIPRRVRPQAPMPPVFRETSALARERRQSRLFMSNINRGCGSWEGCVVVRERRCPLRVLPEREFFIDNLLVRIHSIS